EAQGIDPGHHERLQVRGGEASGLQLLHGSDDRLVELEQLLRAIFPLGQGVAQGLFEVLVHLLQRRGVGAAGEAALLFIREAEGDERRFLELEREVALLAAPSSWARSRYIRTTSSAFSRRLCAFSM